jgi:hypothetical protein
MESELYKYGGSIKGLSVSKANEAKAAELDEIKKALELQNAYDFGSKEAAEAAEMNMRALEERRQKDLAIAESSGTTSLYNAIDRQPTPEQRDALRKVWEDFSSRGSLAYQLGNNPNDEGVAIPPIDLNTGKFAKPIEMEGWK